MTRRLLCSSFVIATLLASTITTQAADGITIELNKVEEAGSKCRTYFVAQEEGGKLVQTLKADFVVFGKDGGISKRLAAELGPVRARKTSVKIFEIEAPCPEISGLLLNDIMACAPASGPDECLDRIALSSRVDIRFFK